MQRSSIVDEAIYTCELARPFLDAIQRRDRDLAAQLRRALSSVALNLAEGFGCRGGNARLRFETARGSLKEAHAALRIAVAWGYISANGCRELLAALDSLGARVFGLTRR